MRDGERVHGPYKHGRRHRVKLVGSDGSVGYRSFKTRAAAETYVEAARGAAQGRTVRDAMNAFIDRVRTRGRVDATLESYEDRLQLLLGPIAGRPLRAVIDRGAELYAAAQVYPEGHRRAGKPRAADTHQNALALGKSWAAWCVKQGWLKSNPFAGVEPVGRRVEGADKPRLTVDESRRLRAYCHAHAAVVEGDQLVVVDLGAVLTLGYLLLGPRASELALRDVRDVDDGGRLLWIGKTKTRSGRRRLLIPDELAPLLVAVAGDRPSDAPLFVSEASRRWPAGRRWSRHMAYNHVRRVCAAAKVPELAPQGLRRTQSTLATDAGATGLMVAQHLGHAVGQAPAVTHRSYVERDSARNADVQRGLRVLAGGRR